MCRRPTNSTFFSGWFDFQNLDGNVSECVHVHIKKFRGEAAAGRRV